MGNLYIPALSLEYTAITPVTITQALGAAGWVTDVDCSGTLPASVAGKLCVWLLTPTAAQDIGIRDVDSSVDNKFTSSALAGGGYGYTIIAKVSTLRKVDLYRAAADNYYLCMGYFS